jgi:hypothetical protein
MLWEAIYGTSHTVTYTPVRIVPAPQTTGPSPPAKHSRGVRHLADRKAWMPHVCVQQQVLLNCQIAARQGVPQRQIPAPEPSTYAGSSRHAGTCEENYNNRCVDRRWPLVQCLGQPQLKPKPDYLPGRTSLRSSRGSTKSGSSWDASWRDRLIAGNRVDEESSCPAHRTANIAASLHSRSSPNDVNARLKVIT